MTGNDHPHHGACS
uniref:Uncharacterized protein n=1 Tax=Arundo donax TaxID=35708 RepID=A0A0A8YWP2_ARUDO